MTNSYISIDIGGTNLKFAEMNNAGEIVRQDTVPTPQNKQDFLKKIKEIVKQYDRPNVKGVAICSPGKIQDNTVYYGGALTFLDGVNFPSVLKEFNHRVEVINDGKASVLAENWLGNLKDIPNCAAITLGTGVGGGIIVNGKLVQGKDAQAGELSAMQIANSDGKNSLAAESCSAVKLVSQVNKLVGTNDLKNGKKAFNEIKKQNSPANELFKKYCYQVAKVIFNIQTVLDLQAVAIGGGISAQPIVVKEINNAYNRLLKSHILLAQFRKPKIVTAKFHNNANLYGALYNLLLRLNNESI